jgi:phenylacetic acid degradation operon negative regulatory protein
MADLSTISRRSLGIFRQAVLEAPVSYSVYSAFSFYGRRHGGELPGPWLVAASRALGHSLAATRQTLYRMERGGELVARLTGRVKQYRLTASASAVADAGLEKILGSVEETWDHEWTLVRFRPGTEYQSDREQLAEICRTEGFALAGSGLFIHPRDRSGRLLAAATELGTSNLLTIFRGRRLDAESDAAFVARHWPLETIASHYEAFLRRYGSFTTSRKRLTSEDAFMLRFALVFDYLETAWSDPELPPELLPHGWPGDRARRCAARLYRRFLPGAIAFGDSLRRDHDDS